MRHWTAAEREVREHAMAINNGRCCWCGTAVATQGCHRLPEGQRGPYIVPTILPGCGRGGTDGCHGATERARTLSYSCGWLIRSDDQPAGRNARIAATPALIRTVLAPDGDWHFIDFLVDGVPMLMPRLAEPGEVPEWMWQGSFDEALQALHGRARTSA